MKRLIFLLAILISISAKSQDSVFAYVAVVKGYLTEDKVTYKEATKYDSVWAFKNVPISPGSRYRVDNTFKIEFLDKTLFDIRKKYVFIPKNIGQ